MSYLDVPLDKIHGSKESRGVRLEGSQIHSAHLPEHVFSVETIFGMHDQRLLLRHESGSSAEPYVYGALLVIRNVGELVGVHRGLGSVMDFREESCLTSKIKPTPRAGFLFEPFGA